MPDEATGREVVPQEPTAQTSNSPINAAPIEKSPKKGMLTVQQYQDRIKRRIWRTFDYISIGFSAVLIYGAFLSADYILLILIEYLFRSEMASSPFLATFFNSAKVGLALLAFILCIVHGVRGAWEQYQRDIQLSQEDEKPHV